MKKSLAYIALSSFLILYAGYLAYQGIYPEFNCILVGINITLTIINACLFWRNWQLAHERQVALADIDTFVAEYLDRNGN